MSRAAARRTDPIGGDALDLRGDPLSSAHAGNRRDGVSDGGDLRRGLSGGEHGYLQPGVAESPEDARHVGDRPAHLAAEPPNQIARTDRARGARHGPSARRDACAHRSACSRARPADPTAMSPASLNGAASVPREARCASSSVAVVGNDDLETGMTAAANS